MTDLERQDLMLAYAADSLEPAEREKVRALLAEGDPKVVGALAEAEAFLARLSATATPVQPDGAIKQKIMASLPARQAAPAMRIGGGPDVPGRSTAAPAGVMVHPAFVLRRLAMAAAIGAIVAGSAAWYLTHEHDKTKLNQVLALVAKKETRITEIQGLIGSANVQFATMTQPGAAANQPPQARVVWDIPQRKWHVYVFDMTPPPPGKVYQLWFLPEGGKPPIPAPTFKVDAAGHAAFEVDMPPGVTKANAAVTAEPPGGSKTPTMPIKLVGNL